MFDDYEPADPWEPTDPTFDDGYDEPWDATLAQQELEDFEGLSWLDEQPPEPWGGDE